MTEHPTTIELQQWIWGTLGEERNREVARHVIRGCPACQAVLAPYAAFAATSEPIPEELDRAYDAAIDRVLPGALRAARRIDRMARDKAKLLPLLLAERRTPQAEEPAVHPVALIEALLEAAWHLRFQNPIRMGHLAERAKNCAERLTSRQVGGRAALADLRCRCWLVLANALRVRDELSDAHPALKRAFSYFEEGSQNSDLSIQLYEVLGALCADERDFASAEEAAHATYRIARDERDYHRAGKALIQAGTYLGWAGRPHDAVEYLEKARRFIDRKREPGLDDLLTHNMANFLVDCGEFKKAQKLIFDLHRRYGERGEAIPRLKLRGIQAKIHLELGDLERAEREYKAESEGLKEAGKPYHAALAELELSVVYLAQVEKAILANQPDAERRQLLEKFYRTAVGALTVFKKLRIDREALGAVILLEKSLRAGRLSRTELEKIIAALRTADRSPRRKLPNESS